MNELGYELDLIIFKNTKPFRSKLIKNIIYETSPPKVSKTSAQRIQENSEILPFTSEKLKKPNNSPILSSPEIGFADPGSISGELHPNLNSNVDLKMNKVDEFHV